MLDKKIKLTPENSNSCRAKSRFNLTVAGILGLVLSFHYISQGKESDKSKTKPNTIPSTKVFKFRKKKITVDKVSVMAEIADTDELRERGLMERTKLLDQEGMLFIFDEARELSFWMKNTLIPLNIGYFDENGVLFKIIEMTPASPIEINPKNYPSEGPAKFALEEPTGWFKRKNIKPGAKLKLPL